MGQLMPEHVEYGLREVGEAAAGSDCVEHHYVVGSVVRVVGVQRLVLGRDHNGDMDLGVGSEERDQRGVNVLAVLIKKSSRLAALILVDYVKMLRGGTSHAPDASGHTGKERRGADNKQQGKA